MPRYFNNICIVKDSHRIILNDQERKKLLQAVIEQGKKNGIYFKKITDDIYSGCLNRAARALFYWESTSQEEPILLDVFKDHDAYMAKLAEPCLRTHYLKHLQDKDIQKIFSTEEIKEAIETLSSDELQIFKQVLETPIQGVEYGMGGKRIMLNTQQQTAIQNYNRQTQQTKAPISIVIGEAGTGKTEIMRSLFENAYADAVRITTGPLTAHSNNIIFQIFYITPVNTLELANNMNTHIATVIGETPRLPCLSITYQDFAAMLDSSIPPTDVNPSQQSDNRYKTLYDEKDFIEWCNQKNIQPSHYSEFPEKIPENFYKKLYQEFKSICLHHTLLEYQHSSESNFDKNLQLRKSLYELYIEYTTNHTDLNFYDLTECIKKYKALFPYLIPKALLDEGQNFSKKQLLNVFQFIENLSNITLCSDPDQSLYDAPNLEFIKSHFYKAGFSTDITTLPPESYRLPPEGHAFSKRISGLIKSIDPSTPSMHHDMHNTHSLQSSNCVTGEQFSTFETFVRTMSKIKLEEKLIQENKLKTTQKTVTEQEIKTTQESIYFKLYDNPNCAIIVGNPELSNSANKFTPLTFTVEEIIGLEFDHVIYLDPYQMFTEEDLKLLYQIISDTPLKRIEPNLLLATKCRKLYTGCTRFMKTHMLILNDTKKSIHQPKNLKKASKRQIHEQVFHTFLLHQDKPAPQTVHNPAITPQESVVIHDPVKTPPTDIKSISDNRWLEQCIHLIKNKNYQQAFNLCNKYHITPEQLHLGEHLKSRIPVEFHGVFFGINTQSKAEKGKKRTTTKPVEKHQIKPPKSIAEQQAELLSLYSAAIPMSPEETTILNFCEDHKKGNPTDSVQLSSTQLVSISAQKQFAKTLLQDFTVENITILLQQNASVMGNILFNPISNMPESLFHYIDNFNPNCALLFQTIHQLDTKDTQHTQASVYDKFIEASKKFPIPLCSLGAYYEEILHQPEWAIKPYKMASEQNHPLSQYKLALCYKKGIGTDKNFKEAVRLMKASSDQGYTPAQYILGIWNERGECGLVQNNTEALRLIRLASTQGNAAAQNQLGTYYFRGNVIDKDQCEAVKLFKLASNQGDPEARYNLGLCYEVGNGVAKNLNTALEYFQLSANQGLVIAQQRLAALKTTRSVPANLNTKKANHLT